MSAFATRSTTSRWMTRLSGRAPNTGSKPSSDEPLDRRGRELERDLALGEPRADLLELQLHDLADLARA